MTNLCLSKSACFGHACSSLHQSFEIKKTMLQCEYLNAKWNPRRMVQNAWSALQNLKPSLQWSDPFFLPALTNFRHVLINEKHVESKAQFHTLKSFWITFNQCEPPPNCQYVGLLFLSNVPGFASSPVSLCTRLGCPQSWFGGPPVQATYEFSRNTTQCKIQPLYDFDSARHSVVGKKW